MKRMKEGVYRDEEPAPAACPKCGKTLDAVRKIRGSEDRAPKAGDFSLCFYCVTVLVFQDERSLIEAEPEEIPDELEQIARSVRRAKAASATGGLRVSRGGA